MAGDCRAPALSPEAPQGERREHRRRRPRRRNRSSRPVRWSARDQVTAALEADAAAARDPAPAARALDHKLGGPPSQRRYTAPTYLVDGQLIPGFNPVEAYETVIANRASELPRRPRPDSVTDVLDWATEPLATAETALIMQLDLEQTRNALTNVGHLHPAGADG